MKSKAHRGRPKGVTKVKIAISIDRGVWEKCRKQAFHMGEPLSGIIEENLALWLAGIPDALRKYSA
jgi:hypothetical protein